MHLPLEIDKPFLYTICGLRDTYLKIAFKVSPGKGGIAHGYHQTGVDRLCCALTRSAPRCFSHDVLAACDPCELLTFIG
jgi:hypothetical protein